MDSRYSDCLCEVGLGRFVIAAPWGMHWTMMTNTGLIYMRARCYDPLLGRFISEDPAKDGGNWFAYAGNNPIGNVDPDGRMLLVGDLLSSAESMISDMRQGIAAQGIGGYAKDKIIDSVGRHFMSIYLELLEGEGGTNAAFYVGRKGAGFGWRSGNREVFVHIADLLGHTVDVPHLDLHGLAPSGSHYLLGRIILGL